MFKRVCEVELDIIALTMKCNLMTKFEWETNNKQPEYVEEECCFTGTLLSWHIKRTASTKESKVGLFTLSGVLPFLLEINQIVYLKWCFKGILHRGQVTVYPRFKITSSK